MVGTYSYWFEVETSQICLLLKVLLRFLLHSDGKVEAMAGEADEGSDSQLQRREREIELLDFITAFPPQT